MKKNWLQKSLAMLLMMTMMTITAFGGTEKTAAEENTDAAGTESLAQIEAADEAAEPDPVGIPEENQVLKAASEKVKAPAAEEAGNGADTGKAAEPADTADTGAAAEPADSQKKAEDKAKDVMILFTSDMHCAVDKGYGLAGLQQIRDQLREQGYDVLLVDDGDAIQGEAIGILTNGELVVDLMGETGYDVAIPGNHEFDYGVDNLLKLAGKAKYPYISCNFTRDGKLAFDPYVIKEAGGLKIAFVGVTTPTTLTYNNPKEFRNKNGEHAYGFMEDKTGDRLFKAVQDAVDSARKEGADLVYLLAHLGNDESTRPWTYVDVISHTSGIDVVLDGHSHDTDQVVMKNKEGKEVVRSAVGTKLSCIGYSHISSDGRILETDAWTWFNKIPAPELFGIENTVRDKVREVMKEVEDLLGTVIGSTNVELMLDDPVAKTPQGGPIRVIKRQETNLGDLCTDAVRAITGSDIALLNAGGMRAPIKKGDISMKNVLEVFPFANSVCVVELKGQQILDALEWGCHGFPSAFGGFLQVSGLSFEIHSYIDSPCKSDEKQLMTGIEGERRVRNVMVGDEPLDPEKTYTVSGTQFVLMDQGDGNTAFEGARVLNESVNIDAAILIQYISENLKGVVGEPYADPYGDDRIVFVEKAPE